MKINELLEQVEGDLMVSRAGTAVYHTALGAGENGRRVELSMAQTEAKLKAISECVSLVTTAANEGDLEAVKKLLTEDIPISSPMR